MKRRDIVIRQGATFILPVMWETGTLIYRPIEAIEQSAPVRLTVPAHGLPNGWNACVMGVAGMREMNAANNPPKDNEFRMATVVDADHVEFNAVNAERFRAYAGGGHLVYYMPADLSGVSARMQIKDKPGGNVLHSLSTALGNITIDPVTSRLVGRIDADEAEAFTWKSGVYDFEVEDTSGIVTPLLFGAAAIEREVTTIS